MSGGAGGVWRPRRALLGWLLSVAVSEDAAEIAVHVPVAIGAVRGILAVGARRLRRRAIYSGRKQLPSFRHRAETYALHALGVSLHGNGKRQNAALHPVKKGSGEIRGSAQHTGTRAEGAPGHRLHPVQKREEHAGEKPMRV